MSRCKKLLIVIAFVLAAVPALAGVPHTSYGLVEGAEASTDCSWTFYVVSRPTDTLSGNLEIAGAHYWLAVVGNLATPWNVGDDSMVIVTKENNSGAINHTAFYAVMNEDLSNEMPQPYYTPTMREMPTPEVSIFEGAVAVSWSAFQTDPSETPHGNNIIGYNVLRSQDSLSFEKINANPVSATFFIDNKNNSEPDPAYGTTYYYAIEPIFRGNVALGLYSKNSESILYPEQSLEGDVELNLTYNSETGNIYWVALPYVNSFTAASDVVAKINEDHGLAADAGDKVTQIGRWDAATQQYETYDYLGFLGWSGTDFNIAIGEAIFVNIASDVTAVLPGTHDPGFAFNLTYNTDIGNIFWISLPKTGNYTDAVSVVADLNQNAGLATDSGDLVTQIGSWNGSTQSYETYDYLGFLGWSGTNFGFIPGDGYFVNLAGDINNWTPSTN